MHHATKRYMSKNIVEMIYVEKYWKQHQALFIEEKKT